MDLVKLGLGRDGAPGTRHGRGEGGPRTVLVLEVGDRDRQYLSTIQRNKEILDRLSFTHFIYFHVYISSLL